MKLQLRDEETLKLIIEPADGVAPVLQAIRNAKRTIEIAIFRLDRKDVETALKAAAARGVRVTALIAFANKGGAKRLRKLELRFLDAGIIVARTSDDLSRYHGKYMVIDRRELYVMSFNLTQVDIDHSRSLGVATRQRAHVHEALRLFRADSARTRYVSRLETLVVSPVNSRRVLAKFLKQAKSQLLIYDPNASDALMLRLLLERAKAGVDIKIIGRSPARRALDVRKFLGKRLHTRTIIRDRRQAFVGSQSLRAAELDERREVGLIVQDAATVRKLVDTFKADWTKIGARLEAAPKKNKKKKPKQVARAVEALTEQLKPLAKTVKKAVREAVVQAGDDVLGDKEVKATMKKVVKQAVKEAVKDAVHEAHDAAETGERD